MKTLLIVFVLILGTFSMTGCTVTETRMERNRRISQINDLQLRMLVEDWDYLWLQDRNTATTQWNPWVGI